MRLVINIRLVNIYIETFGTEKSYKKILADYVDGLIDLSVQGIINTLDLRKPIYQETTRYGHFGYEDRSWEKCK